MPGPPPSASRYDADGNLTRVDFPADSFSAASYLRLGYDAKRNPTFLADAAGNALVWEYDRGRRKRTARYTGFVDDSSRGTLVGDSKLSYDVAGRLLKAFNPLFPNDSVFSEVTLYDTVGNVKRVRDENTKEDEHFYDEIDRLAQLHQIRTATYETAFDYDTQSNVSQVTDPATKATDYEMDDFGNLVEVTSPDTGITRYLYDVAGNLVTKIENAAGSPVAEHEPQLRRPRSPHAREPPERPRLGLHVRHGLFEEPEGSPCAGEQRDRHLGLRLHRSRPGLPRADDDGGSSLRYDHDLRRLGPGGHAHQPGRDLDHDPVRRRSPEARRGDRRQARRSRSRISPGYPFGPRARAELPPYDAGLPPGTR